MIEVVALKETLTTGRLDYKQATQCIVYADAPAAPD